MKFFALVILVVASALALACPADAAKKEKRIDRIWTHPEIANLGLSRIAMLPAATFDNDFANEKVVENLFSQSLRETGYRWISPTTTRGILRQASGGNDSLLKVAKKSILDTGRLDLLLTPMLCGLLRADAILVVRIDQWEQTEVEQNQSGKPSTSIQLRAALVDSSGALLWTAAGSQTGEGTYHEANAGAIGMTGGALERKAITGQGGAPSFAEVLTPLLARWTPQFPAKPASAATTSGPGSAETPPTPEPVPVAAPTPKTP